MDVKAAMVLNTFIVSVIMMAPMTFAQRNCETVSALQLPANTVLQEHSKADSLSQQGTCVKGSLLPNIYVLGAQKSATTTLAYTLMRDAGVKGSTEVIKSIRAFGKESFIVANHLSRYVKENMTDPAVRNRFAEEWLSLFSSCEEFPHSSKVGEFTAENLAFTDPAFAKAKGWPAISVEKEDLFSRERELLGFDLPPVLRTAYGNHFERVRFVVLLREPISRVQSLLYQFPRYHERQVKEMNFKPGKHLRQELLALVDKHVVGYNIWHGLYGRHLLEWFSYWPSSQFLVLPYKYLTSETEIVCQSVQQHLSIKIKNQCARLLKRFNDKIPHPSLEEEVPEDLLSRANQALKIEFKLLVDVLVNHSKSAVLPALKSEGAATHADVEQWVVRGW